MISIVIIGMEGRYGRRKELVLVGSWTGTVFNFDFYTCLMVRRRLGVLGDESSFTIVQRQEDRWWCRDPVDWILFLNLMNSNGRRLLVPFLSGIIKLHF